MSQFTTYSKVGDAFYHLGTLPDVQVPKKFTSDPQVTTYDILRGLILSKDPTDTTKDKFIVAPTSGSPKRPFVVARGKTFKVAANVYVIADSNLTYYAALNTDQRVKVGYRGTYILYVDGIVQPFAPVMPSTAVAGHVMAWDGVDPDEIVGYYQGLTGQRDGKYLATASPSGNGTLGVVSMQQSI